MLGSATYSIFDDTVSDEVEVVPPPADDEDDAPCEVLPLLVDEAEEPPTLISEVPPPLIDAPPLPLIITFPDEKVCEALDTDAECVELLEVTVPE